jgi:hypothetical protein
MIKRLRNIKPGSGTPVKNWDGKTIADRMGDSNRRRLQYQKDHPQPAYKPTHSGKFPKHTPPKDPNFKHGTGVIPTDEGARRGYEKFKAMRKK